MKQLLVALAVASLAYTGAEAQTKTVACGKQSNTVCRTHALNKTKGCYKTRYNQNFKVCKGDAGYSICCEAPSPTNSTHYNNLVARRGGGTEVYTQRRVLTSVTRDRYFENAVDDSRLSMVAPQNQSYPFNTGTTPVAVSPQANHLNYYSSGYYQGYYPGKGKIKVCYTGENVAELNKAPYEGCNTPAFDGIDKNKARNLNVVNPVDVPPSSGTTW